MYNIMNTYVFIYSISYKFKCLLVDTKKEKHKCELK